MRYHYERPKLYTSLYGEYYICNHPVYSECTLFRVENKGLAVIQQRFNPKTKHTFWSAVDPWLANELYLNPKFMEYFLKRGGECGTDGLYPTVTLRQMMWALRMKPLKRERWETVFDRTPI